MGGGGGWGTSCNGLYGRLRPKGIHFSGFKYVTKGRESISSGTSKSSPREICHFRLYNGPKGLTEKSKKCSGFVVYSSFKDSVSTVV